MDFADVVVTVLGAGMILLISADVFQILLYPHGTGPVWRMIMCALWLLSRPFTGRGSTIAVPAAMAADYVKLMRDHGDGVDSTVATPEHLRSCNGGRKETAVEARSAGKDGRAGALYSAHEARIQ